MTPEIFIQLIRSTFGEYPDYSQGCLKFAIMLVTIFDGELYYDHDHVITKIDDKFYDIRGEVTAVDNHLPAKDYGLEHFATSFSLNLGGDQYSLLKKALEENEE